MVLTTVLGILTGLMPLTFFFLGIGTAGTSNSTHKKHDRVYLLIGVLLLGMLIGISCLGQKGDMYYAKAGHVVSIVGVAGWILLYCPILTLI